MKVKKIIEIYIDIKKAFDTVDHLILLQKLYNADLRGKTFDWLALYLSHRTQIVKIRNTFSRPRTINRGAPLGSVLGLILFLVCINYLCGLGILGRTIKFADDTVFIFSDTYKDSSIKGTVHL